jgi:hypothetical protein
VWSVNSHATMVYAVHERSVRLRRGVRRLAMIVAPAALMIPAVSGKDSFPVSTYPMYAFLRSPSDRFQAVLGVDSAGVTRPLPMGLVADTNDPLIAESLIAQAIGTESAARLCERVAARVDGDIDRVLVVEEVHNVIDRLRGLASVQERVIHASCTTAP